MKLAGKVALVTGAGRGIGRAIALRLAQEGAGLVVHFGNSRQGADEVVQTISKQGGKSLPTAQQTPRVPIHFRVCLDCSVAARSSRRGMSGYPHGKTQTA